MDPSRPFGRPSRGGGASGGFTSPFSNPFGSSGGQQGGNDGGRRSGRGGRPSRADTPGAWGHDMFGAQGTGRGAASGRSRGRGQRDDGFQAPFATQPFSDGGRSRGDRSRPFRSSGGAGGDVSRPFGQSQGGAGRRMRGGASFYAGDGPSAPFSNPFGGGGTGRGGAPSFGRDSGGGGQQSQRRGRGARSGVQGPMATDSPMGGGGAFNTGASTRGRGRGGRGGAAGELMSTGRQPRQPQQSQQQHQPFQQLPSPRDRGGRPAMRGDDSTINAIWVKTPTPEQNTRTFLYPYFQRFGRIANVVVERNFAIVKFNTYEEAEAALRGGAVNPDNPSERLRLQWAKPKREGAEGDAPTSPGQLRSPGIRAPAQEDEAMMDEGDEVVVQELDEQGVEEALQAGDEEVYPEEVVEGEGEAEQYDEEGEGAYEEEQGEGEAEGEEDVGAEPAPSFTIRRTIRNDGLPPAAPAAAAADAPAVPRLPLSQRIKFPARPVPAEEAAEEEAVEEVAVEGEGEGEEAQEEEQPQDEVEGEEAAEGAGAEESATPVAVRRMSGNGESFRITLSSAGRSGSVVSRLAAPLGEGGAEEEVTAAETEASAEEEGGQEGAQAEEAHEEAPEAEQTAQSASAAPATRSRLAARLAQALSSRKGDKTAPKSPRQSRTAGRLFSGNTLSPPSSRQSGAAAQPPSTPAVRRPSVIAPAEERAVVARQSRPSPAQPRSRQHIRNVPMRDLSELRHAFMTEQDELHKHIRQLEMQIGKQPSGIVGLCRDMCAASERQERELNKDLSRFEMEPGTEHFTGRGQAPKVRHEWAVKKYHRPTVDLAGDTPSYQRPEEVRPPDVLMTTMEYLTGMLDRKDVAYTELEKFVRDRTRAIRQDFVLQRGLADDVEVEVVERICRFHILSDHRLCEEDQANFDQQMNLEQLNKSLITLAQLYADHAVNGVFFPTEGEFRSYFVLTHLDTPVEVMSLLLSLRPEVYNSLEVQTALEASSALRQGNYVRFFDVCRKAPYLLACLLHRYWPRVRAEALATMNLVYGAKGSVTLAKVVKLLALEDENEAESLCLHFGLPCGHDMAGPSVLLGKAAFVKPKAPLMRRVSHTIIEPKSYGISNTDIVELPTSLYSGPSAGTLPVATTVDIAAAPEEAPEEEHAELEEHEEQSEEEGEKEEAAEGEPEEEDAEGEGDQVEQEEQVEAGPGAKPAPLQLPPPIRTSSGAASRTLEPTRALSALPATLPLSRPGSVMDLSMPSSSSAALISAASAAVAAAAPLPVFAPPPVAAPVPLPKAIAKAPPKPLAIDMHFVPVKVPPAAFTPVAPPTPAKPKVVDVRPQKIAALQEKRRRRISGWAFKSWRKLTQQRQEARIIAAKDEEEREREYSRALATARLKPFEPLIRWEGPPTSAARLRPIAPQPPEHLRLPIDVPKLVGPILAERNPGFSHLYWKAALVLGTDDRFSSWLIARMRKGGAPPPTTADEEVLTAALWQNNTIDPDTFERLTGPPLAFCISRTRYAVDCAAFDGCTGIIFVLEPVTAASQRQSERQRLLDSLGTTNLPVLILRRPRAAHVPPEPSTEWLLGSLEGLTHLTVEFLGNSDDEVLLEDGVRWLANSAPSQPFLSSALLEDLVHSYAENAVTPLFRLVDQGVEIELGHFVGAFNHGMEVLAGALGANATENSDFCWPPAELADFFSDDAKVWKDAVSTSAADAVVHCCLPDPPASLSLASLAAYVQSLRPPSSSTDFYPLDERVRQVAAQGGSDMCVCLFKVLYQYALFSLGSAADQPIFFPKGLYSHRFAPEQALQDVPYELGAPVGNVNAAQEEEEPEAEEAEPPAPPAVTEEADDGNRKRRFRDVEEPGSKRSAQEGQSSILGGTPMRRAVSVASEVMDERKQTQDFVLRLQELLANGV